MFRFFSAEAARKRLLEISSNELTPKHVLALISDDSARIDPELLETNLRKPAGLTKAETASNVDLALHFQEGKVSEHFLKTSIDETEIQKALLQVQGIRLSSCDMCLIFFGATGCFTDWRFGCSKRHRQVKKHQLFQRDGQKITERLLPYKPYFSLRDYYMWRAADTPLLEDSQVDTKSQLDHRVFRR